MIQSFPPLDVCLCISEQSFLVVCVTCTSIVYSFSTTSFTSLFLFFLITTLRIAERFRDTRRNVRSLHHHNKLIPFFSDQSDLKLDNWIVEVMISLVHTSSHRKYIQSKQYRSNKVDNRRQKLIVSCMIVNYFHHIRCFM